MKLRTLLLLAVAACGAGAAHAQKIAPGLWEHTISMKMAGGEMEEGMKRMQDQLASMPPEKRKQLEDMMARQGTGGPGLGAGMSMMSGKPTTVKVCVTPEQAARDYIPSGQGNCQQMASERSGNTMKIKFSCSRPDGQTMTGEGEFTLVSTKEHRGHMVMDGVGRKGGSGHMEIDQSGRWLGADCGDVKPHAMPPAAKK